LPLGSSVRWLLWLLDRWGRGHIVCWWLRADSTAALPNASKCDWAQDREYQRSLPPPWPGQHSSSSP